MKDNSNLKILSNGIIAENPTFIQLLGMCPLLATTTSVANAVGMGVAVIAVLAFSNVLNQYGGYLRENTPVVITGRLSVRDDKEPQIIVNRARPITDYAEEMQIQPAPVQPVQPVRTVSLRN